MMGYIAPLGDAFVLLIGAVMSIAVIAGAAITFYRRKRAHLALSVIVYAASALLILYMMLAGGTAQMSIGGFMLINQFSLFFSLIFTVGILLVNIIAYAYSKDYNEFALLASFALIGMYMVAFSLSLVTIFIGLELAVLPAVFMILLSRKSLEAAAKLFVAASLSTALLSFAIVLTYGGSGTAALAQYSGAEILGFAAMLFIVSLGFEASIFPFNVLLPDVYSGSPAHITSMLGGVNKKVGFAALMQVLILGFIAYRQAFILIAVLSVFTMFYGNLVALMQDNIKRMMAYSSISQAGYIMIGIAVANAAGISASLFQIFAHMFIFIGVLAIIAWLEGHGKHKISDIEGLHSENRFLSFSLALLLLSLAGLPFTTGFIGKFLIFLSSINSGMVWLAFLGIINSIISIYYYARVIAKVYTGRRVSRGIKVGRGIAAVVLTCVIITLVFGIWPQPLMHITGNAAAALFPAAGAA